MEILQVPQDIKRASIHLKPPFNKDELINSVKRNKKSLSPSSKDPKLQIPDVQLRKTIGPKKLAMRKISMLENVDVSHLT